jgi:hypothetical protein
MEGWKEGGVTCPKNCISSLEVTAFIRQLQKREEVRLGKKNKSFQGRVEPITSAFYKEIKLYLLVK